MRLSLLNNLCCPNCRGDLTLNYFEAESNQNELIDGFLICKSCGSYPVVNGISVLLPRRFSNIGECAIRKKVSEDGFKRINDYHKLYDIHHFRTLSQIRIHSYLKTLTLHNDQKNRILDIGVGWGLNYLPFVPDIDLWGLDFSFESLLLLKKIYEKEGRLVPTLICASLNAIPLIDLKFNLVWSSQVYQHISDVKAIESSFDYIISFHPEIDNFKRV